MMKLPESNRLEIAPLSASFGNVTNSYKFYWLLAILENVRIAQGRILPVDDLLVQMIASVWYPLHYYRLSFGKQDRLGEVAERLRAQVGTLDANASRHEILNAARTQLSTSSSLARDIRSIGNYVPQRFLRPFFQAELRAIEDWKVNELVEKLADAAFQSRSSPCLYRFVNAPARAIEVHPLWWQYLHENLHIVTGFCLWHLANYLQKNNPNVPNVTAKLFRPEQRDLKQARMFWRLVMQETRLVRCIYTQEPLAPDDFSLDHFIPWSFVAHDLLWNIVPTTKSVNSRKGDRLPSIDLYFEPFVRLQYEAVQAVTVSKHAKILEDHVILARVDSVAALRQMPFGDFRQLLFDNIAPQIQVARNMGFPDRWRYQDQ